MTFGVGPSPSRVELRASGQWRVIGPDGQERSELGDGLALIYEDRYQSAADGPVGYAALQDVAAKLRGAMTYLFPIPAPDPNKVY